MKCNSGIVFVITILTILPDLVYSRINVEDDLRITYKEKQTLDKFKEIMEPQVPHDYMKTDIYLVRWLRAQAFNIPAAEKMLRNSLKWRKENRIDDIDNEDWSYHERNFNFSVDSVDKRGQPLLIFDHSTSWDVRGVVLQGGRDKLVRWMVKMLEDATKRVRELQKEGKNVTRFSMVNTLENFNIIQSGCLQCLSVYTAFSQNYENHYPKMMADMTLVNTPGIFDVVIRIIRPVLTPSTRESLRLLGTNKKEWVSILRSEIDDDQLPVYFGGNKVTNGDYDYY